VSEALSHWCRVMLQRHKTYSSRLARGISGVTACAGVDSGDLLATTSLLPYPRGTCPQP
jgi:hypothetical protein